MKPPSGLVSRKPGVRVGAAEELLGLVVGLLGFVAGTLGFGFGNVHKSPVLRSSPVFWSCFRAVVGSFPMSFHFLTFNTTAKMMINKMPNAANARISGVSTSSDNSLR